MPRHPRLPARQWPAALLCLLLSFEACAQLDPEPRFDSYADLGGVGLMQMPSARFAPDGELPFPAPEPTRTSATP